jgi:hypothetical protein
MQQIEIKFLNSGQEQFYGFTKRNQCFSGGIGNGKTTVACQKLLTLLLAFPGYRVAIARKVLQDLKKTTMATFFKQLAGGKSSPLIKKHDEQNSVTQFINGSEVLWIHLDTVDEMSLRGLEINSAMIDQAEEISEAVYLTLDSRVGRWDGAQVPDHLNPAAFPKTSTGKPRPPSYMMVLVNPDVEWHWVWRRFHYDSPEWQTEYKATHDYVERGTDESAYDPETIKQLKTRDKEWQERFFFGKWGVSEGTIHNVSRDSIITVTKEWLENLLNKAALYRALDHGEASPTCCTWWAAFKGQHFCYREYYVPHQVISYHRREIDALGYYTHDGRQVKEQYTATIADPQIFKKTTQKYGSFWTVAQEYTDPKIAAPPLVMIPADNNELSTRNRVNELLGFSESYTNPLTGEKGGRGIYFINKIEGTNYGCWHALNQTRQQRREVLDTINGKVVYSDERDDGVEDHAYDTVRYYVAFHAQARRPEKVPYRPGTFGHMVKTMKALKKSGYYKQYGL